MSLPRPVSPIFRLACRPGWQVCIFLLSLFFVAAAAPAALFYRVEKALKLTDLNPGADGSIPMSVTGLNTAGRMCGYFPSAVGNKLHAFVWDYASQAPTDISAVLGADSSMATCMNEDGTVAGIFWEQGSYAQKGFVYYTDGTVAPFRGPDTGQGAISSVAAISASGSVIGTWLASDYRQRGFVVEQYPDQASTILDLGDIPGLPNGSFWLTALNNANQIVGDYFIAGSHNHPANSTYGFIWDNGSINLLDLSNAGPAPDWTADGINNNGVVFGLYAANGAGLRRSYVLDGSGATDLGDLGGTDGTIAAVIDGANNVFGTAFNAIGSLDLFCYSDPQQGAIDLGGVSVYDGDQSFQPISLSVLMAAPRGSSVGIGGSGSSPSGFDLAGFGTDAVGNTRALLWKNGSIHSVIDLMPRTLAFAAISSDYGSKVLINSAEQIACAGTDVGGQQMALLLSIDPDTLDNGLPDIWELEHGLDPYDPDGATGDPDKDGISNLDEYLAGTDPQDFYNGTVPTLAIISGNHQSGPSRAFLANPLVLKVTDEAGQPEVNAPVAFTASVGSRLALSNDGTGLASTLTVRTDATGRVTVYCHLDFLATASISVHAAAGSVQTTLTETNTTPVGPVGKIAAGYFSSYAIQTDATLWAWGANSQGELGNGANADLDYPHPVTSGPAGAIAIAPGSSHLVLLAQDYTVWTAGSNFAGELGNGTAGPSQNSLAQISTLSGVQAIAAGDLHSLALLADGTVWSWGSNYYYQLGTGTDQSGSTVPVQVPDFGNVVAIAAGVSTSLALKSDGTVWMWGGVSNSESQYPYHPPHGRSRPGRRRPQARGELPRQLRAERRRQCLDVAAWPDAVCHTRHDD